MAYGSGYGYGGSYGGQGMNTAPIFPTRGSVNSFNVPTNGGIGGGILWVQGEACAKSFLVAPGNTVQLMDSEATRFYIKTTGPDGMPHPLRIFEYREVTAEAVQESPRAENVVTRAEYEALKGQMDDLVAKFDALSAKGGDKE